jgi:ubiquinol-cytochrome c reductase cytochrome c subunit
MFGPHLHQDTRGIRVRLLSSRRRHPAAKALLLVLGLFMMGALYTVIAPPAQVSAETGNSQQVAEGKALFAVGCASCHGLNGEGQISGVIQGPPLAGVGAAAVDFQVSTGRMPMARPGEQAAVKPNRYSEEEVAALAA